MNIRKDLSWNIARIKDTFRDCGDVVMREVGVGHTGERLFLVYIDNIVDGMTIRDAVMTNIMCRFEAEGQGGLLEGLMERAIAVGETKKITTFEEIYNAVLLGDTALLMEGNEFALQTSTKGFPNRGVSQAQTEVVVQGPKDAFLEVMAVNIVLIRRRIRDTNLKLVRKKIGSRSQTDISLMYLADLVRPKTLQRIEAQLEAVSMEGVLDSGALEQLLEKRWLSPFPQLQMTERPDKAASAILEGRVVVVVDNTPFVVMLPATLNVFFQAAEDYYERWEIMSFLRAMRYVAAFVSIALPGLYIAFSVYHPELLPTALALKIATTRQYIPFSVVGEVLIMELAFELLREAGVRLPSPVSSTMGIVGGIIIGSAAIEAGITSPAVVIVSALTGICTFVIPNVALVSALRLSKYLCIFFGAVLGLFGVWLSLLLLLVHLSGLTSYGIPYLYPFCSATVNEDKDWEDTVFRMPLQKMKHSSIFKRREARGKEEGEVS